MSFPHRTVQARDDTGHDGLTTFDAPVASTAPRPRRLATSAMAGLLCLLCHLVALAISHTEPFGPHSIGVGDFGTQYLPFHSLLRQVLTGSPLSSWTFTWTLGTGVPVLPDYATYFSSPFAMLVALLPAARLEIAMVGIVLLKLALAAATMTYFLRSWRPGGAAWLSILLGVGYATSSWVVDTGFFTVQWLDSLYMLPLLMLATLWARHRRHAALSALVVGWTWWANYYTAYMASIGAVLFLVTCLLAEPTTLRRDLRSLLRFAVTGLAGVGLAGLILVPAAKGLALSTKTGGPRLGGLPVDTIWVRLLPFTEGVASTPGIFAGSLALVLAAGLPAAGHLRRRLRLVWVAMVVLQLLAMDSRPLVLVWNAFDDPNGNPYRYSFVVCALLACMAWQAWSGQVAVQRRVALLGLVLVAVLVFATRGAHLDRLVVNGWARWMPLLVGLLLVCLSWLRGRGRKALGLALGLTVLVESVANVVWMNGDGQLRGFLAEIPSTRPTLARSLYQAQVLTGEANWPQHRVGEAQSLPEKNWLPNDPALNGYPGTSYYSTLTPRAATDALLGLGFSTRFDGRRLYEDADPVLDMLLSTTVRATSRVARPLSRPHPKPVMPMVRTLEPNDGPTLPDVFANRNRLFSSPVYSSADAQVVSLRGSGGALPTPSSGASVDLDRHQRLVLRASCAAGEQVVALLQSFTGTVSIDGHEPQRTREITYVPLAGSARRTHTITLAASLSSTVDPTQVGCLDVSSARRQVAATRVPTIAASPGVISASWTRAQQGRAVVATTALEGWACTVDGQRREVQPLSGLLSVDMAGGRSLRCSYHQPGLRAGELVSVVFVLALGGLAVADLRGWVSSRRRGR